MLYVSMPRAISLHELEKSSTSKAFHAHDILSSENALHERFITSSGVHWCNRRGGRMPPSETSDWEIFADLRGKCLSLNENATAHRKGIKKNASIRVHV